MVHILITSFEQRQASLSEKRAYLNIHADDFSSPIYIAMLNDHLPVVRLLLSCGADPNLGNAFTGENALQAVVRKNNAEAVKLLLSYPG